MDTSHRTLNKANKEKDGYVGDLKNKSRVQLLEILKRQDKILNNVKFTNKLPDKGAKTRAFRNEISRHLAMLDENEKLCSMFNSLDVDASENMLTELEWSQNCMPGSLKKTKNKNNAEIASETENVFKMLATHSGSAFSSEKIIRVEKDEPLIVPTDFDDLLHVDKYTIDRCHQFDKPRETPEKFYPNKSLANKSTNNNNKENLQSEKCETPRKAKTVDLEECINIHQEQVKKLKEAQIKNAVERLSSTTQYSIGVPKGISMTYRIPTCPGMSSDEEGEEGEDDGTESDDSDHPN